MFIYCCGIQPSKKQIASTPDQTISIAGNNLKVYVFLQNAFELYGADFMLTEDLRPWLIEINCSPSMSSSTKITTDLCHSVLEDTVKG